MGFADFYFERQKNFQIKIQNKPNKDLKYIVVIPCFNEFKLVDTLKSIRNCEKTKNSIEVLIVINSSEDTKKEILDQNIRTYTEAMNWIHENEDSSLRFFILHEKDLPRKFAGAGLARKIGMDQAIARFNQLNNENGILISIDADSKLKSNYFVELEKHFTKFPKTKVITSYFEHPISGDEFDIEIYEAISKYELYLRYYKQALSYTGFPYSYYTIGSCFSVNAKAYVKQGGMNRKQAGEDFYFLHKIFPLGNSFELNSTCVYPSSRISDRVPFGTGPMIKSIVESGANTFETYNLNSFVDLQTFFSKVNKLFKADDLEIENVISELPVSVVQYLKESNFKESLKEINQNSSSIKTFTKRFYNWFDAFRVLKFLNFTHERYFNKQELLNEAQKLLLLLTSEVLINADYKKLLIRFREIEKKG